MKLKKLLAIVLSFAMVLSTMGTVAFADNTEVAAAKVGDVEYATLDAAFGAAAAGDTVTIFEGTYKVPTMKAGITVVGEGEVLLEGTLSGTLEDLTLENLHIKGANAQRWAYAKGDLVFKNVTFEATSVYALHFDGITADSTLRYEDCTIIGWAAMGGSPKSCVFDGCTIKGNGTYGLIRTYFDTEIKDCTFDVENVNKNDVYQDGIHAVDATIQVEECTNVNGDMKDIIDIDYEGYIYIDDELVLAPVAKVGDKYYPTLAEAVTNANKGDTIVIYSKLDELATLVNGGTTTFNGLTVKLGADIDLKGEEWTPIGNSTNKFQGIFDGDNHTISNLVITGNKSDVGLFGFTTNGEIKNLTVKNASVSGRLNVGVVAGHPYTTKYTNISVTGHVEVNGMSYVGGVGGKNAYADWTNINVDVDEESYVNAVSTEDGRSYRTYVGGVIGFMGEGGHTVKDVTSNINVIGDVCDIGGIVGIAHYGNKFENVTCSGNVTNTNPDAVDATETGGIAGVWHNEKGTKVTFTNCSYTGKVTATGVAENTAVGAAYNAGNTTEENSGSLVIDDNTSWPCVARIGLTGFKTLQEAVKEAEDGDVITLIGEVATETVKLPVAIKDLTITGAKGAKLKDSTIMASDGNSINYDGLTIENITFDNSRISLTGWRTNGASIKNLVIQNNVFVNLNDTTNSAPVHINMDAPEAVEGFTFINNVINGATGGSKSGIYAQVTGDVLVQDNVINNVAFRPFVIQVTTDDGIEDSFVVKGNTFSNSANGRLQALGNNAEGTDKVNLVITENIIHEVPGAQEICYWNFNPETTTADLARNYFGANLIENPNGIYYNISAASVNDLIDMGIFPYYTELNADGTINKDSLKTVVADANGEYKLVDVNKVVDEIKVAFEKASEAEGEKVYNINLIAADDDIINRLNSVDLTFALTQVAGENDFEIIASNEEVAINPVDNSKVRYEFHYNGKDGVKTDCGNKITIGQVKFTGYGTFDFAVATKDENGNDIITNATHATKLFDNIVDTFVPGGVLNGKVVGKFDISDETIKDITIAVPTKKLTIKVDFPNAIAANVAAYQDMKVEITGVFDGVNKTVTYELGEVMEDGSYVVEDANLVLNNAYTVTVSGAGYRTARYTVTMTEDKALRFWNNVMDEAQVVEIGKDSSAVNVTFLAGDIVKDNKINIYDLSAVVSYFGTENLVTEHPEYAKYDLNRDGVIDSKDVAYVLVSWNN